MMTGVLAIATGFVAWGTRDSEAEQGFVPPLAWTSTDGVPWDRAAFDASSGVRSDEVSRIVEAPGGGLAAAGVGTSAVSDGRTQAAWTPSDGGRTWRTPGVVVTADGFSGTRDAVRCSRSGPG